MAEIVLQFEIPDVAPSLNKWYSGGRNSQWLRKKAKDKWRKLVKQAIVVNRLRPIEKDKYPLHLFTISYFPDKRKRDSDNWITANKLIADALKTFKIIPDDDLRYISLSTSGVVVGAPVKKTVVLLIKDTWVV